MIETGAIAVQGDLMEKLLLGAAGVGGILWAVWERIQKARIQKSSTDAGVAVNVAQEELFRLLTTRMTALEADYTALRQELAEERKHSRMLDIRVQHYQIHVMKLEAQMRAQGLEPPVLEIPING
jgi:predicted amino acid-binding ACT domain protein